MEPKELSFYFTKGGTLAKGKKAIKLVQEQKACKVQAARHEIWKFSWEHGTEPLGLTG